MQNWSAMRGILFNMLMVSADNPDSIFPWRGQEGCQLHGQQRRKHTGVIGGAPWQIENDDKQIP